MRYLTLLLLAASASACALPMGRPLNDTEAVMAEHLWEWAGTPDTPVPLDDIYVTYVDGETAAAHCGAEVWGCLLMPSAGDLHYDIVITTDVDHAQSAHVLYHELLHVWFHQVTGDTRPDHDHQLWWDLTKQW